MKNNTTLLSNSTLLNDAINNILNNRVTCISASTGSGKTLAIPYNLFKKYNLRCLVSEPRVVNVLGAFKGVKSIYNYEAGYVTALYKRNEYSNLLFATDGYISNSLNMLDNYDILFIDEAHEFNSNIEILFYLAQQQLIKNPKFRVVILSATIKEQIHKFETYFNEFTFNYNHYEGYTYPISEVNFNNYEQLDLIKVTKSCLDKNLDTMMFLSSKESLIQVEELFNNIYPNHNFELLRLSSESEEDVKDKLFDKGNKTRLWLATNVAQAGLTPVNLACVILTGYKYQNICDTKGNSGVERVKISLDDAIQQKGRCGRMFPGICIWAADYPISLCPQHNIPEIQRISLDKNYLSFSDKSILMENITLLHQPDLKMINLAKKSLIDLDMIDNDQITELGRECSKLPLSPINSKAIILAEKYNLSNFMIHIMSILDCNQPLIKKEHNNIDKIKTIFGESIASVNSDIFTYLQIYMSAQKNIKYTTYLNQNTVRLISDNIKLLVKNSGNLSSDKMNNANDIFYLLCEAFYKNLYVKIKGTSYYNHFTQSSINIDRKTMITTSDYVIGFPYKILDFVVLTNIINISKEVVNDVYHKEVKTTYDTDIDYYQYIKYEIKTLWDIEISRTIITEYDDKDYKKYSTILYKLDSIIHKQIDIDRYLFEQLNNKSQGEFGYNIPSISEHFVNNKIISLDDYQNNPFIYDRPSQEEIDAINAKYPNEINGNPITYYMGELPLIQVVNNNLPQENYRYYYRYTTYSTYNDYYNAYTSYYQSLFDNYVRQMCNQLQDSYIDINKEVLPVLVEQNGISQYIYPYKKFIWDNIEQCHLYYTSDEQDAQYRNDEFNNSLSNLLANIQQNKYDNAKTMVKNQVDNTIYSEYERDTFKYKCIEVQSEEFTFYIGWTLEKNRYNYIVCEHLFDDIETLNNNFNIIKEHFEQRVIIQKERDKYNERYSQISELIDNLWNKNKSLARQIQSARDRLANNIEDGNFDSSELDNLLEEADSYKINSNISYTNDNIRITTQKKRR